VGVDVGGKFASSTNGRGAYQRNRHRNNSGVGPFLSNGPTPLRVPALHASGAGRGISRACDALVGTRHRAVGSGGHQTNVDGDDRSGNDGHRRGTPLDEERGDQGPFSCGAPAGGARGVQRRRQESAVVAGDPSTSRSGARTFAGSPATWRLLSLRGWGGAPRSVARPPALWSCDSGPLSGRGGRARGDCCREPRRRLTHLPAACAGPAPGRCRESR
jgi:hypothetical protein